jgi:hypothetical protein
MFQQIKKMNERSTSLILVLLLSADFVFIMLHIIIGMLAPNSPLCNITGICAYINVYHLIKLFWVIVLFAFVLKLTKCVGYVSWILLFTYLFLDDALLLHQRVGDYVSDYFDAYFPYSLGLPPRYFELAVLALAGIILLAIVAWAYFHSPHIFRKISIDVLLLIAALVFFGLIVDLAVAVKLGSAFIFGLGFVEDGGELVVDSLILWYVFLLVIRNGKPNLFLHDLV